MLTSQIRESVFCWLTAPPATPERAQGYLVPVLTPACREVLTFHLFPIHFMLQGCLNPKPASLLHASSCMTRGFLLFYHYLHYPLLWSLFVLSLEVLVSCYGAWHTHKRKTLWLIEEGQAACLLIPMCAVEICCQSAASLGWRKAKEMKGSISQIYHVWFEFDTVLWCIIFWELPRMAISAPCKGNRSTGIPVACFAIL